MDNRKADLQFGLFVTAGGKTPRLEITGPKERKITDGRRIINTTSCSRDWGQNLSPFHLGPVDLYGGYRSRKMENAWQYTKVYPQHVGEDGKPNQEYYRWAKSGWDSYSANRYPMGKGIGPLFSYWDGQRLGYVEARKRIYVPLYAKTVVGSGAFARLKKEFESVEHLVLWDFDGFHQEKLGMSLLDVLECENRPMGHAFVLAMMLLKDTACLSACGLSESDIR